MFIVCKTLIFIASYLAQPLQTLCFMNNIDHTYNDRMAGSVPVWKSQETSQKSDEQFGFADIVDMINPLQHIPLVNMAYQNITGDEIKPVSQIVGGAVFGGALGAGGAVANVIIEAETGKDIGGHALAMVEEERVNAPTPRHDHPEDNLNNALAALEQMDALTALAYADLSYNDSAPHKAPITELHMKDMPEEFTF